MKSVLEPEPDTREEPPNHTQCSSYCAFFKEACLRSECRQWINWGEDMNCTLIAVAKHGSMTLKEVGKRLGLSTVEVHKIETEFFKKTRKLFVRNKELSKLKDYLEK